LGNRLPSGSKPSGDQFQIVAPAHQVIAADA
jgi:hypothetical protein